MKIALFSNFFNNHMSDLCDELYHLTNENFLFISKTEIIDSRKRMGFVEMTRKYVKKYSEISATYLHSIIENYDLIITGSNSDDIYKMRLKTGKLVFKMSEHPFKGEISGAIKLLKRIKWLLCYKNKSNSFLLAMSSRCASDFGNFAFRDRILNFGYFPSFYENDLNEKEAGSIIWVGRMEQWKHPEIAVEVVSQLLKSGFAVKMMMVGAGYSYETIKEKIENEKLENFIELVGFKSQKETIELMRKSRFFLFTSDTNEGWGAVLNEAMNSKCVCLASKYAGSTLILLNNQNGLITENTVDDIVEKMTKLLNDDETCNRLSLNAYETISNEYNGKNAAKKIIDFVEYYNMTGKAKKFDTGLLSPQLRK